MLGSGFVELSCVVSIMTKLESSIRVMVSLFLSFWSLLEISVMSGREVCRCV